MSHIVRHDGSKAMRQTSGLAANAAGQSLLLVVLPPLGRRLGFSDMETGAILRFRIHV
jgi:DHA1 family tetracycline resistance protein-like MFS transporter